MVLRAARVRLSVTPGDHEAHGVYLDILKTEGKPAEMLADGLAAMADAVEDFDFDRAVELTSLFLK